MSLEPFDFGNFVVILFGHGHDQTSTEVYLGSRGLILPQIALRQRKQQFHLLQGIPHGFCQQQGFQQLQLCFRVIASLLQQIRQLLMIGNQVALVFGFFPQGNQFFQMRLRLNQCASLVFVIGSELSQQINR